MIAKNEKTRAFYDAYQRDVLEDDNEDFAHLEHDDMDMLEEDDENEPPETVSAADIRDQLREAARNNKGKEKVLKHQINSAMYLFLTIPFYLTASYLQS